MWLLKQLPGSKRLLGGRYRPVTIDAPLPLAATHASLGLLWAIYSDRSGLAAPCFSQFRIVLTEAWLVPGTISVDHEGIGERHDGQRGWKM